MKEFNENLYLEGGTFPSASNDSLQPYFETLKNSMNVYSIPPEVYAKHSRVVDNYINTLSVTCKHVHDLYIVRDLSDFFKFKQRPEDVLMIDSYDDIDHYNREPCVVLTKPHILPENFIFQWINRYYPRFKRGYEIRMFNPPTLVLLPPANYYSEVYKKYKQYL